MPETDTAPYEQPARRRRPRLVPAIAAIAFIALTVSLGNWQLRRASEKAALAAEYDQRTADQPVTLKEGAADDMRFRRVVVHGEFDAGRTVYIDNRIHRGVAGYHIVTPLRLSGGRHVLVNRGWIAAGATRATLPDVSTPAGPQTIEGIAVLPPQKVFELGEESSTGRVRMHLMPARLAEEWKLPLERFVLQQTSPSADGLVRQWERPDTGMDRHRAYALQWYSFAAITLILYVVLGFRRPRRS
jgi:surfeit locus 1 family protein